MTTTMLTAALEGARRVGELHTDPEAIWNPFLLFDDEQGVTHIAQVNAGDGDPIRSALAYAIETILREHNSTEAVLSTTTWVATYTPEEFSQPHTSPAEHPDRTEAVTVTHVTRDTAVAYEAPIIRHEGTPPTLGEFTEAAAGLEYAGKFVDAMRRGIG